MAHKWTNLANHWPTIRSTQYRPNWDYLRSWWSVAGNDKLMSSFIIGAYIVENVLLVQSSIGTKDSVGFSCCVRQAEDSHWYSYLVWRPAKEALEDRILVWTEKDCLIATCRKMCRILGLDICHVIHKLCVRLI